MHVGENIGEVSFHSYISGKFRILFWVSHEIDDSQSSLATCSSNLEPFSNEDRAPFERGSIIYKNSLPEDDNDHLLDLTLKNYYAVIIEKFSDEIIARLSELSEDKISQITFFFATEKLNKFIEERIKYRKYMEKNGFVDQRNKYISHKHLPKDWTEHRMKVTIPFQKITKALAIALSLQKKLDSDIEGPSSKYLWKEMRKKRYDLKYPAGPFYMLLPYLRLEKEQRAKIFFEEQSLGFDNVELMNTKINGVESKIPCNKKWGIILFKDSIMVLDNYPLNELGNISIS